MRKIPIFFSMEDKVVAVNGLNHVTGVVLIYIQFLTCHGAYMEMLKLASGAPNRMLDEHTSFVFGKQWA